MKKLAILVIAIIGFAACANLPVEQPEWIGSMVDYSTHEYMPANKYKWDWSQATLLKGLLIYADSELCPDRDAIIQYTKDCLEHTKANENGKHPNAIASAHALAYLAKETGNEDYRLRAMKIYEDFLQVPRAENGGISHRDNVTELWDDTIYMIGLFLIDMYKLTGDEQYLTDFADQLMAHHEKLANAEWGLWYHGWDADTIPFDDHCSQLGWASNPNQRNNEFWGRGNGWLVIACADALEVCPKASANYQVIKEVFIELTHRLSELQDTETGHWYNLPQYPGDEDNWIESSCTSMFGYGIAKGLRLGILSKDKFQPVVESAYKGMVKYSTKDLGNGYTTTKNVCTGTCPGDKQYYYDRQIIEGKHCALGTFIMFGVEHCQNK